MADKPIVYDVTGTELLTTALRELINTYPGLNGETITFATLGADSGKAMFPTQGAVIQSERRSITGHVTQNCQYPFSIYYRAGGLNENRKLKAKEWLDNFGKWLEMQPVSIDGTVHQLEKYPDLTGGREIQTIRRTTPAYLESVNQNKSEDWVIALNVVYRCEFQV